MQILIKFNGSFYALLSNSESMKNKIYSMSGLNRRIIKIMNGGTLINFDTMELFKKDSPVFDIIIKRDLVNFEVNLPNGNIISIVLPQNKKIIDVKLSIDKKEKITFNHINLEYNRLILKDDQSILECFGEEKEPKIIVHEKLRDEVVVNVTCRRRGYNDEIVTVKVLTNHSVRQLKEIINEKCSFDIPPDNQRLCYIATMEDEDMVEVYNIEDGSWLVAVYGGWIDVYVKDCDLRHGLYLLTMNSNDTVRKLKEELKSRMGLRNYDNIELSYLEDRVKDEITLTDYNIRDGDRLTIIDYLIDGVGYPKCRITMKGAQEGTFSIDADRCMTVMNVREMVESREGYRGERHDLFIDGRLLRDEECIYRYKDNIISIVDYKRVQFQIAKNDEYSDLVIDASLSVTDIKKRIFEEFGLFEEIQQLFVNGTRLNDDDKVLSCALGKGKNIKRVICKLVIDDGVHRSNKETKCFCCFPHRGE